MIRLEPDINNNIVMTISRDYFNQGEITDGRYAMIFVLRHEDSYTKYIFQPIDISNNSRYYNEFIIETMSDLDSYNPEDYAYVDYDYVEEAYLNTDYDQPFGFDANDKKYDGILPFLPGTYRYDVYIMGYRTGNDNNGVSTPVVGGNFDIRETDTPTETGIAIISYTDLQNPKTIEFNLYDDDIFPTNKNLIF